MVPSARRLAQLALVVAALVLLALVFRAKIVEKMPDLEVYWTAAVRARAAEPLYRAEDQHYQFKYLPAFALLAIPLGLVPLDAAKAIWFAASLALAAAVIALSRRALPETRRPAWLLVAFTILVMGKFYAHEIVLGQMNALFAVVVLLALAALREGREARGGLLVALAVVVKPYAVLFLPWLAGRRRPASIGAAAAGLVAALALPAVLYGIAGNIALHRAWWRTVTDSTAPNLTNQDNVSLAAFFAKWLDVGPAAALWSAAAGLALIAIAVVAFAQRSRVRRPDALEVALVLTLIPLLSPQGWDYVFLIATPAVMLIANYSDRLPYTLRAVTILALATIGLTLYDVMGRAAYRTFMAWSLITVCFVVVVAALVALRLRRAA